MYGLGRSATINPRFLLWINPIGAIFLRKTRWKTSGNPGPSGPSVIYILAGWCAESPVLTFGYLLYVFAESRKAIRYLGRRLSFLPPSGLSSLYRLVRKTVAPRLSWHPLQHTSKQKSGRRRRAGSLSSASGRWISRGASLRSYEAGMRRPSSYSRERVAYFTYHPLFKSRYVIA